MKKILESQIMSALIAIAFTGLVIYYLLLTNKIVHLSIDTLTARLANEHTNLHLIMIGFIPIYIAFFIFGAGFIGVYLCNLMRRYLLKNQDRTPHKLN